MDAPAQSPSKVQLPRVDTLFHGVDSESRNGQDRPPRSPPYDAPDTQRPSLPPIKMMLAGNMASPPRTPKLAPTRAQPRPQEPMYNVDTYRPPSLYPNKKQKTEVPEPTPQLNTMPLIHATPALSGFGAHTNSTPIRLDLPQIHSTPFPQSRSPISQREDSKNTPNDALPPRSAGFSSPRSAQFPPPKTNGVAHATPYSASSERGWTSRSLPTEHRSLAPDRDDSQLQRAPNGQSSSPMHPRPHERPYAPAAHHESFSRSGGSGGEGYDRAERPASQHMDYCPAGYPPSQPAEVFMPGSYEYYYPKARKRSNLPKHSTEVMRTWFDQNIANPYPSEDQKASFANATGISLTQVSNWFINHRRRCPELRDKRAERRKV